jgi:hypothetical protein
MPIRELWEYNESVQQLFIDLKTLLRFKEKQCIVCHILIKS